MCGGILSFFLSQVTTSAEEYRLAICLCGTSLCRQSFLDFVASDSTQQLLTRWHSPADRFAMLFDASVSQVSVCSVLQAGANSTTICHTRCTQEKTRNREKRRAQTATRVPLPSFCCTLILVFSDSHAFLSVSLFF